MDDSSMAFLGAMFQGHGLLRPRGDRSVDMRQEIVAATAFVLTLATIVTVLRAYVRRLVLRQWGMDDWAAMVSYVLVLATGIIIALTTHYGIGTPLMSIPPEKVYMAATLTKVSIITYQAAVTSLKATFLLQYRRIFPLPNFQRLCDAVFFFNLLFGLSLVLSFAIRCTPPSAAWKFPPPPGPPPRCFDVIVWWYVNAGVNLATDLIILIMPVPLLRSLPLARKPKMILIGIFALGSFTTAINIIRITSLKNAASVRGATYSASLSSIFAIVELCSATVCVCVPTLRPLIGNARRQMSSLRGKKGSSSKIAASPLDSAASSGANSERIDKAIPTPALRAFHFQGRESGSLKPQGRKTRPRAYDLELGPVAALRRDLSMAWTVGTGTGNETDDEYGGVETRDEPLTPLCPPPRSHVAGDSRTGSRGG